MTPDTVEDGIDASPTKDFFIDMLTRDIPLKRAIIDLVDNAVDAARAKAGPDGSLAIFEVVIEASGEGLSIRDNCGGMTVPVARDYAFRFGRPEGSPDTPGSIGRFGVGMKRALFKLGTEFSVQSRTTTDSFLVSVNVDEWRDMPEWRFAFDEVHQGESRPEAECGTQIRVGKLHDGVKTDLANDAFLKELWADIQDAEQIDINRGLVIRMNAWMAHAGVSELLTADDLRPVMNETTLDQVGFPDVRFKMFAGLATSNPREAGWYVYCNGRLVLGQDTTSRTVWGVRDDDPVPRYHNQFARFRGYAFFESSDSEHLPWTTTKTDVDVDHPTYRYARRLMSTATRQVIDFLNQLKKESDEEEERGGPGPLAVALERAVPRAISQLQPSVFVSPEPAPALAQTERWVSIQYSRPTDQVETLRRALNARSAKQVGELSFDYVYEREGEG